MNEPLESEIIKNTWLQVYMRNMEYIKKIMDLNRDYVKNMCDTFSQLNMISFLITSKSSIELNKAPKLH